MICLPGNTNSKLISTCACFTCRIGILVKRNEQSLQEIPTKINYWNQEAGCNYSPPPFPFMALCRQPALRCQGYEAPNCILSTWYIEKHLLFIDNFECLTVFLHKSLFLQELFDTLFPKLTFFQCYNLCKSWHSGGRQLLQLSTRWHRSLCWNTALLGAIEEI